MPIHRLKANSAGFTLIEMMIVLVIIGVLLLVAVPGYQESMKKSRRADAMRDLMELVSREERFYAQNSQYTAEIALPGGLNYGRTDISTAQCVYPEGRCTNGDGDFISSEGHYDLSVVKCPGKADGDFSTCYILQAVPIATGLQKDDKCGTLSVNSKGQRSASGSLGDACW
jgi:type IV pilus assembly protein PilE